MLTLNDLETARFGVKCAKLNVDHPEFNIANIISQIASDKISFVSARIDTNDIFRCQELEAAGFLIMDTIVCYELRDHTADYKLSNDLIVSDNSHAEIVSHIAKNSFENYFGHYHCDKNIDSSVADAIYVDWAFKIASGEHKNHDVLLCQEGSDTLGFITVKFNNDNSAEMVLSGVSKNHQGKGVYGKLCKYAVQYCISKNVDIVFTSTQVNNIAVQRAWTNIGFRISKSYYTFHRWFDRN